jgi:hypothetical protein
MAGVASVAAAISAADRSLSLVIRFSPLDVKSRQRLASLWKWSSDRPIKVTIPHLVSTPREACCAMRPSIAGRQKANSKF